MAAIALLLYTLLSITPKLAPNCPTSTNIRAIYLESVSLRPPPWHLRIPSQTRQGNTELAPNCYTIIKRPPFWHLRIPL
jgi:hypothetical protein